MDSASGRRVRAAESQPPGVVGGTRVLAVIQRIPTEPCFDPTGARFRVMVVVEAAAVCSLAAAGRFRVNSTV